jgi:branched-chain amino acid transport system substrate-binding protein
LLSFLVASCSEDPQPAKDQLRIGALVPHTGIAASVGPEVMSGIEYALTEAGYTVAGREVVLIDEDEGDNPANTVTRVRKLVEEDRVDVVIGPMLAHTSAAVAPFLAREGIPHLPWGMAASANSPDAIYTAGTGVGNAWVAGQFAATDMGAKRAAVLVMDYALGHQMRDGFRDGFIAAGGEVVSTQLLPLGTGDLAPWFENLGDADVLAVLLVNPTDFAFVRQYHEFGLDLPVVFISAQPQEEPLLSQMGEDVVGMYGVTMYGPDIDSPANQAFVESFRQQFGKNPGIASVHAGYWTTAMVLEAARRSGHTDKASLAGALTQIEGFQTPAGPLSIDSGRMGIHDVYAFRAERDGERVYWRVVRHYPAVKPAY